MNINSASLNPDISSFLSVDFRESESEISITLSELEKKKIELTIVIEKNIAYLSSTSSSFLEEFL